ncbi:MAG: TRAP transporter small permease subunit [Cyanobacteria bacterium]|nr:TRAP transporter small permease subunit [Cyanobacteria bacterium CG_2015-22_32_23]NCQ05860.1 TRAP transporter small permease subunit [Cyanobacteria bacterium CG_2015-09_32_10]NCQ43173.1 TRAP transporter small permease subunit [Cyanobacteria bacterium CG_2015-04_32_10]
MNIAIKIAQIIDLITEWYGKIVYWLVLVMIGIGVWNVIGRYLGKIIGENLTSNSLIELQWYIFDLIFFLGAAYTLKKDNHVRVDIFYKDLPTKRKALINIIGVLFFLIPFCGVIIYFSWQYVFNSWQILEISPDDGGLPRYPIKTLIIISPILLIIQGISELIKNLVIFLNYSPEKIS